MPPDFHFDESNYLKFIGNVLIEYIPILMFDGRPAVDIRDYITRNHIHGAEKRRLMALDKFIQDNFDDITSFILARLSAITVFTIERVLRRHSLTDYAQLCLSLAIVTGFMAFCFNTEQEGQLDTFVSAHTRAEALRVDFERRHGLILNRINCATVIPVDDHDTNLPYKNLHSMAFPDLIYTDVTNPNKSDNKPAANEEN